MLEAVEDADESADADADADDSAETDDVADVADGFADEEEEAPVPVSYEGIPSWEEAISYLQRRPRDSNRGDGSRGRGSHRR